MAKKTNVSGYTTRRGKRVRPYTRGVTTHFSSSPNRKPGLLRRVLGWASAPELTPADLARARRVLARLPNSKQGRADQALFDRRHPYLRG